MDILNFLGLDYRVASLIQLYFVVPGINIPKIRRTDIKVMIIELLRFLNRTKGNTMQSLILIGQF